MNNNFNIIYPDSGERSGLLLGSSLLTCMALDGVGK
jgi:hypothetical protein